MKNIYKIYLIVIFVMLTWGINVSAIKVLVENFLPITITSFRIFVAGIIVFIVMGLSKMLRLPISKEWYYVFGGALFSVVLHHYFLATGLTMTSAINTGLILGMGQY